MLGLLPLTYYTSPLVENGVKARQNTQTNNQVFIKSANARAMPCHSRVYCRKPAVHPALGSSPADRSCCRYRAEPLVRYRGTVASLEVECYASSLRDQ